MRMMLIMFLITFYSFCSGQTINKIWRHLPDSTYTAKLVGMSGTNTAGNEYSGTYDTSMRSHYFNVVETGWYYMYWDPAGGTSYILDSDWSVRYIPGGDARLFSFHPDSGMTLSESQRLFTYAARMWLTGTSLNSVYLPNEISIKLNPSDSTYYVNNFVEMDTLTPDSATPSISTKTWYRTANIGTVTYTDFTNNPGVDVPKIFYIHVLDDSIYFQNSSTFDCGGVDLAPDSLDVMEVKWTGLKYYIGFDELTTN